MNIDAVIAEHEFVKNILGSTSLKGKISIYSGNNFLGKVGFKTYISNNDIEIGPYEDKLEVNVLYRGRGFGSLLLQEAVDYVSTLAHIDFSFTGVITAATSKDNIAAQRILEKNGFRVVKVLKQGIEYERNIRL